MNHPQFFLASPTLRASSSLLQWSSSSPRGALCWLGAAAWLSHMCFWGLCHTCGCVCTLCTAQNPRAVSKDLERLPAAGLRAASLPCTGGAETEECQELLCYWSWESRAKI